ncbi:hypothetical protein Dda_6119 [Drechslerella dactyloides]|uniref:Uncharacterized protein n=1 Tax=Drechslerella dactyloides TaxID=74499 RepID=A0AAD6IVJ8_DREDA|nr:hypothetical protein Dda_6119 [Drechslerella dactyloides]
MSGKGWNGHGDMVFPLEFVTPNSPGLLILDTPDTPALDSFAPTSCLLSKETIPRTVLDIKNIVQAPNKMMLRAMEIVQKVNEQEREMDRGYVWVLAGIEYNGPDDTLALVLEVAHISSE